MNISQVVVYLSIFVVLICLVGFFVLVIYVVQLSKRYSAYKAELKRTGKYEDWVTQNKILVGFEKISWYLNFVFLPAMLVYGFGIQEDASPKLLVNISTLFVYLLYPYLLISLFLYSRLYRKVPKEWLKNK